MADKEKTGIESRIYTINLSKAKAGSRNKRAGKAMRILKQELKRNGEQNLKIANAVNHKIWGRGVQKPPTKIEVQVIDRGQQSWVSLPGEVMPTQQQPAEEEKEEEAEVEEEVSVSESTVEEVKEAVKAGNLDAKEALDAEQEHKDRKSLTDWLQTRMDEGGEEEKEDQSTSGLSEEVTKVLEGGSIEEGKEVLQSLSHTEFQKALNFEEEHQNRKGMKKFIESNMR